jgi:CO/xanthine dehydrogenase FAD-binding subunit
MNENLFVRKPGRIDITKPRVNRVDADKIKKCGAKAARACRALALDMEVAAALDCAMTEFVKAVRLEDALSAAAGSWRGRGGVRIIAGGTDVYPAEAARTAWMQPAGWGLLDISAISDLRGVAPTGEGWRIGALATWTDLIEAPLPPAFDALKAAARQVGGMQIQNRGTIGGNLCNASPAADGAPPLLALDAAVELQSERGLRRLPLAQFIKGNRETALARDELLTAVIVPQPHPDERSAFLKLGARSYLVISIASVAANIRLDGDGRIAAARIAVGACSAAPLRLHRLERALAGHAPDDAPATLAPDDGLSPIDDIRASAAYRRAAAETLVRRAVASFALKTARPAA